MKTTLHFRKIGTDHWFDWKPAHSVWLLQQLEIQEEDGGLGPNAIRPYSFAYEGFGRWSPGSVETPWKMTSIEQWAGAALQVVGDGPDTGMYEVGGVLLERNCSTGGFANYITAVIDPIRTPMFVSSKESPRGLSLLFGEEVDRSRKTIYEVKCERMNTEGRDVEVAVLARRCMKGECKEVPRDLRELPNTLGAMFISEVSRSYLMLPLGIMMIDLIEANVHYGTGAPKPYTWKKLMSYTKDEGEGRIDQAKLVGGKHPMMHENSIKEAQSFMDSYNAVTRRALSVLVTWIHMYLRSNPCGWETLVGRDDDDVIRAKPLGLKRLGQVQTQVRDREKKHGDFFYAAVRPALQRRCSTLNQLL